MAAGRSGRDLRREGRQEADAWSVMVVRGSWRERPEQRQALAKSPGRRVHGGKGSERRKKGKEKGKTETARETNDRWKPP